MMRRTTSNKYWTAYFCHVWL